MAANQKDCEERNKQLREVGKSCIIQDSVKFIFPVINMPDGYSSGWLSVRRVQMEPHEAPCDHRSPNLS